MLHTAYCADTSLERKQNVDTASTVIWAANESRRRRGGGVAVAARRLVWVPSARAVDRHTDRLGLGQLSGICGGGRLKSSVSWGFGVLGGLKL